LRGLVGWFFPPSLCAGSYGLTNEFASMKHRDIIGSLFWMAVGVIFCLGSLDFGFSHMGTIGGGFFPFVAGIALISLSAIALVTSLLAKKEGRPASGPFLPERDSGKKLLSALLALLAYVLVLKYLGFVLTTFFFMVFLLRFIEPQRWAVVLGAATLTSGTAHIVFNIWLKVQLPRGFWGI
jgi:putative tricarboxylic transport membrane protein